jgi:ankyrin repeat protein
MTALILASIIGDVDVVEALLKNKADPTARDLQVGEASQ